MSGQDTAVEPSVDWQQTLNKVVAAAVAIRFCTVRSFETFSAGSSVASGFVVDKKRGIILTNRHVVRPGPVVAEAIFLNHEEVTLYPIYRDPVHDFGFFRFNPADVKFMEIEEIPLAPLEAKVGVEIRVLGNDAGEKLSILSGTLARLDRPAPVYGSDTYNDFNTFYYQAASSTSGGSSGSPVINLAGKALGMVAGGKVIAASSFYLPLHRVARALEILQTGSLTVPRGTLQCIFRHSPYDEIRRLGLQRTTEEKVRKELTHETGMLTVNQVIPEGPVDGLLEPGDVLVSLNGQLMTSFFSLESLLDDSVGEEISLQIERGGQPMEISAKVVNLHEITPIVLLEFGGGVLQPLSYQQARNHRLPVGGVSVASEGYALGNIGAHRGSVIKSVGTVPTPSLAAFEAAVASFPHNSRVPIRFFAVTDRHREKVAVLTVDRQWHPMQRWERRDDLGRWERFPIPLPSEPLSKPPPVSVAPLRATGVAEKVVRSLVMVKCTIPYVTDGIPSDSFVGAGFIVDVTKGWIVVDRNTVPLPMSDVTISFGATLEIPGQVLFMHPVHNIAVVQYDPLLLGESDFRSIEFSSKPLQQGDSVWLVALSRKHQPVWQQTTVSKEEELFIPEAKPPRFRTYNEDVFHLEKVTSSVGGVLVDDNGSLQAVWASYPSADARHPKAATEVFGICGNSVKFFRAYPVTLLQSVMELVKAGKGWRSLATEWRPVPLAQARELGLSVDRLSALQKNEEAKRHLLSVRRLFAGSDAAEKLRPGDVLLTVAGELCWNFQQVERLTSNAEVVDLTILRDGKETQVTITTQLESCQGTTRVVCWSGALLQETPRAVAALGRTFPGVYCSRWYFGSPAHQYSLRGAHWIVQVNGKPTPTLDAFLETVNNLDVKEFVRLKVMGLQDKVAVITLKVHSHYWPTWILEKKDNEWQWEVIQQELPPPMITQGN